MAAERIQRNTPKHEVLNLSSSAAAPHAEMENEGVTAWGELVALGGSATITAIADEKLVGALPAGGITLEAGQSWEGVITLVSGTGVFEARQLTRAY